MQSRRIELTRDALFSNDQIGLNRQNSITHDLDLLLFDLQNSVPVLLLCDLNVGLRFTLLVLQGAIKQHDSGVLDASSHLGVRDVLVQHESIQNPAILNLATRNLLNTGISLDVHFGLAIARVPCNGSHSLESKRAHLIHPSRDELGADRGRDELGHGLVVIDIDR